MFDYKWQLSNGYPDPEIKYHGRKVYSTFACGGGSTMGYKLAGYDVIGANDIDPQMAKVYQANHNPQFYDLCPIGELLTKELPSEYYDLDILDGSPPCSTFSIAGDREKAWKKDKKFREGQSKQVLSDLFFDWIKLVNKLQPKIAIAENVRGMLFGNAKAYIKLIIEELESIGYEVQLFLLDASKMGVPQRRERVFLICRRQDLKLPELTMNFNKREIIFLEINDNKDATEVKRKDTRTYEGWLKSRDGQSFRDAINDGGSMFGYCKVDRYRPIRTIVSSSGTAEWHYKYFRSLNTKELCLAGSYPLDYNFIDIRPKYLIGMSVPPVMMAQVAHEIYKQIFKS